MRQNFVQKENYDIMDYFLENFSLEDEHQCKRILYNIIADGKSEYFDIFYKKYFSKRDVEILSYLFKNDNGNTAFIKLLEKNSKMAFYFISVFRLENYLMNYQPQMFRYATHLELVSPLQSAKGSPFNGDCCL